MHPDWTLRVPVVRPRAAAWLDGAVIVAAMAAMLFALRSLAAVPAAAPALALAVLAAAVAAVAYIRAAAARRTRNAVSAIRMDRDGAFHLRMRGGWQPAEWVAAWRGPRWLTVQARVPAEPTWLWSRLWAWLWTRFCYGRRAARPSPRRVHFTVWQDALPAPAWRRACLLVNRRLCRTPASRAARVS